MAKQTKVEKSVCKAKQTKVEKRLCEGCGLTGVNGVDGVFILVDGWDGKKTNPYHVCAECRHKYWKDYNPTRESAAMDVQELRLRQQIHRQDKALLAHHRELRREK